MRLDGWLFRSIGIGNFTFAGRVSMIARLTDAHFDSKLRYKY